MRLSSVDIVAMGLAILAVSALGLSTLAFVDGEDLRGFYFFALGAASAGASLRVAGSR